MTRAALLLAAALLLSGCVKPPAAEDEAPAATLDVAPPAAAPATAELVVVALFSDRTPLAGVDVAVGNESRATDAAGEARFLALPPGTHVILATKTAHRAAQQQVDLAANESKRVEVVLAAEDGGQHAHALGFDAHHDTYRFEGSFDCSATYVIITGDCLIVVDNVTSNAGLGAPVGNATSERNIIDFPLDLGWSALVVEMSWSETAPTSDGMTLALEPAEAPADGHAAKYARADGASPLRIDLRPGVKHDTATEEDMPNPDGGEVIRARAFVRGFGHHPGGTDLMGVGVQRDHAFTLWVSVFYGGMPPDGYTAVG